MQTETRHLRRQSLVSVLGLVFALVLGGRLVSLQLFAGDTYATQAKGQHEKRVMLQANRGRILDRNGRILSTNLEAQSFFVNEASELDNLKRIAVSFSRRGTEADVMAKLIDRRFVWLARKVVDGLADDQVPDGVGRIVEMKRSYPMGSLAGQVLGYTDIDNEGIEGLEYQFSDILRGRPGELRSRVDARGRAISALGSISELPSDGADLVMTIDADYQSIAEEELAAAVGKWDALSGVAIVMDPRTAEILAMTSVPLYDPNRFSQFDAEFRRNRAVTDLYEPGSTFKIVTIAGAIEEGLATPESEVFCENGTMAVPGGLIRDVHPEGWLNVRGILSASSNIGTAKLAQQLGPSKMFRYARMFGFGSTTGIELPGEVAGDLKHPSEWSRRTLETISIGQEVAVTALQMATSYATIANGGELMVPQIVKEVRSDSTVRSTQPVVIRRVLSEQTAETMRSLLQSVVEKGTGSNAAVPGYRVAGKTSTAQRPSKHGGYDPDAYVSSFAGFLPADNPELLCLVIIDSPERVHWGSQVAAPVFSNIMKRIVSLHQTPTRHRVAAADLPQPSMTDDGISTPESSGLIRPASYSPPRARRTSYSIRLDGRISVPDLLGSPLRGAVSHLTKRGLKARTSGSGWVVRQSPPAGTPVVAGTLCKVVAGG